MARDEREQEREQGRVAAVLARVDSAVVHRVVASLPKREVDVLRRLLGVPTSALRDGPQAARMVRSRAGRMAPRMRTELALSLAAACNDDTVEALGDRSADPTADDMLEVLPAVLERHGAPIVALMMAAYVDATAPCATVFAQLLDTDERLRLDVLGPPADDDEAPHPVVKRGVRAPESGDDADREARRRARKEEQRAARDRARAARDAARQKLQEGRRRAKQTRASMEPSRVDASAEEPVLPLAPRAEVPAITIDGRPIGSVGAAAAVRLSGSYVRARVDDPLVGAVVLATVPFDDGSGSKVRPAVVVAGLPRELVVRPCYSAGGRAAGDWRAVEIGAPAAAGLDAGSFVSFEEVVVARTDVREVLGHLADADWRAL